MSVNTSLNCTSFTNHEPQATNHWNMTNFRHSVGLMFLLATSGYFYSTTDDAASTALALLGASQTCPMASIVWPQSACNDHFHLTGREYKFMYCGATRCLHSLSDFDRYEDGVSGTIFADYPSPGDFCGCPAGWVPWDYTDSEKERLNALKPHIWTITGDQWLVQCMNPKYATQNLLCGKYKCINYGFGSSSRAGLDGALKRSDIVPCPRGYILGETYDGLLDQVLNEGSFYQHSCIKDSCLPQYDGRTAPNSTVTACAWNDWLDPETNTWCTINDVCPDNDCCTECSDQNTG